MGLDTSHDAWHGPYSSFMFWRRWLAEQIGIPLILMEGFYDEADTTYNPFALLDYAYPKGDELAMSQLRELRKMLPLKWDAFKPSPLHELLYHSDCDGELSWEQCGAIAGALKEILAELPNDNLESRAPDRPRATCDGMYNATDRFMKGCELAYSKKESLDFH